MGTKLGLLSSYAFGVAVLLYLVPDHGISFHGLHIGHLAVLFTAWRILYQVEIYPEYLTPSKHIPAIPNRGWLRGNGNSWGVDVPYEEIESRLKELLPQGETFVRFYMVGNIEQVICTSLVAIKEILVSQVEIWQKPSFLDDTLRRVAGDGILLAKGHEHQVQRKGLQPAFNFKHIKGLYQVFWNKSVELIDVIREDLDGRKAIQSEDNTVEIATLAHRATLDIIGEAGMGAKFDSLRDPKNELAQAYHKITGSAPFYVKILFFLSLPFGLSSWTKTLPLPHNVQVAAATKKIRSVALDMIREKMEKMKDPNVEMDIDIISAALESKVFTEENLVEQCMTFLGGGHDTTAAALQWAIYALCKDQNVQERLRAEIRDNLNSPDDDPLITAAQIDELPYLNAVCNEVLRLYPSIPRTMREAACDTTLDGKFIPKGTIMMLCPRTVNQMTEYWGDDAKEFNPERFMKPGQANRGGATNNYASLTFLHGARSCIGQRFAQSELACLVAAMVGRLKMELKYPNVVPQRKEGITSRPRDGLLVNMTAVEGW